MPSSQMTRVQSVSFQEADSTRESNSVTNCDTAWKQVIVAGRSVQNAQDMVTTSQLTAGYTAMVVTKRTNEYLYTEWSHNKKSLSLLLLNFIYSKKLFELSNKSRRNLNRMDNMSLWIRKEKTWRPQYK